MLSAKYSWHTEIFLISTADWLLVLFYVVILCVVFLWLILTLIKEINQLLDDAKLLQKNGVFAIVLECIKTPIAKKITRNLNIPTIGIGSSVHCDGQVLVTDDLIGLNQTNIKFVKKFLNVKKYINTGLRKFASEVRSKKYPTKKHSY